MLNKQAIDISFAKGLDTKTDPWRVPVGNFLGLQNTIFTKGGLLQKRNGFQQLIPLPDTTYQYLTTLNDNLTALGTKVAAYSAGASEWVTKGTLAPLSLSTLPLIRNNANQTQADAVVAPNGLVCTVYTEKNGATTVYKYAVADSVTGQNIVAPTLIPAGSGAVTGSPRVFLLANYFIIVFTNVISATSHLQYIAIAVANPIIVTAAADLASAYVSATTVAWDGVVANNNLYIAYNTTTGGQSIQVLYLQNNLTVVSPTTFVAAIATMFSLAADVTNPSVPKIYISFYDSASATGYTAVVDQNLNVITAPQQIIASGTFLNLASAAQNGVVTVFGEVIAHYTYTPAQSPTVPSDYIDAVTMTQAGVVGTPYVVVRSVGLASKAFIINGVIYFLSAYQSAYQNTYFLINGSTSVAANPQVVAKIAYENGGGYDATGIPNITVNGNTVQFAYLYKDLIQPLATLDNSQQTTEGGVYSQTGINLASIVLADNIDTAEIASCLQISGGFGWMYDGYLPVEENFFLWPDNITATWSSTGGSMAAQPDAATNTNAYFYQVVYEWADNNGNVYRSAPSIPVAVTTLSNGTSGSVSLNIPTLRLTYKTANPVKICVYRWSVKNQTYYQISQSNSVQNPVLAPELNDTTVDSVIVTDTWADASIVGNNIIYTTGGVLENVNSPASNIITLFDTRAWKVDAEDPNLLWFSKQVIEAVPVEWSDLLTFYIAPTTGAQGSTGKTTALAPLDDKLVIFKANAIYYINGAGPDNTGANNQYSQPIFVTSTVGSIDQQSIVFTPQGLQFKSDKGIWLLGRDMSTQYIGAPVEAFNGSDVLSAVNVPDTNQVRFTLSTGEHLMYDYYYQQWGTFVGVPATSSCIYNGLHTFINSFGQVYQEQPGFYLDGSNPVLISFTTSWLNLAGLQGYQRAYFFYLLGQYLSPHKLQLSIAYDYNPGPSQSSLITPLNNNPAYGNSSPYGQGNYGGVSNVEQWRVFLARQRCQAFQIKLQEIYDPSFGFPAGQGLTLSGINLVVGVKKGWKPQGSATSVGGGRNTGG